MDEQSRYLSGLAILITIQVMVGTTAVYWVRRRKQREPIWSWPKTLGAYVLLAVVVFAVGWIPVFGQFAAVIVSLVGIKRLTGLDVLSTFILSFVLGTLLFVVAGVLSRMLDVDLVRLHQ